MLDPTKKIYPTFKAKERPQQDGRRGKITFRIRPHTSQRCLEDLNKTLCTAGPRDPIETEKEVCLSVSCGSMGQHWTAAGAEALGATDLVMVEALMEEVSINPTTEPPELT